MQRTGGNGSAESWHYGLLFVDDAGQGWFCGYDDPGMVNDGMQADAPVLRKMSLVTTAEVRENCGDLADGLPAEGEFVITDADPGTVTVIPWWSRWLQHRPNWPGGSDDPAREKAVLDAVKARAAAPAPAPATNDAEAVAEPF